MHDDNDCVKNVKIYNTILMQCTYTIDGMMRTETKIVIKINDNLKRIENLRVLYEVKSFQLSLVFSCSDRISSFFCKGNGQKEK